jgi:hypothetical protein
MKLKVQAKPYGLAGVLLAFLAPIGLLSISNLGAVHRLGGSMFDDRVVPLVQLGDARALLGDNDMSGALYPVAGLPAWLEVLNRINPLTYAVDPMRHLVFSHLDGSETARQTLDPGVTWWGWHLPPLFEAGMVLLLGLAMMAAAIWRFSRTE